MNTLQRMDQLISGQNFTLLAALAGWGLIVGLNKEEPMETGQACRIVKNFWVYKFVFNAVLFKH